MFLYSVSKTRWCFVDKIKSLLEFPMNRANFRGLLIRTSLLTYCTQDMAVMFLFISYITR
jgi:hypothetical protein